MCDVCMYDVCIDNLILEEVGAYQFLGAIFYDKLK